MLIEPRRLELVEVKRPSIGDDEVLLRVRAVLTCGTDLKTYLRGHPKWPTPTPLGHEFSGELAEVGRSVRGFHEGDPVMAAPTGPCDECFWCHKGQANLCESLMREMVLGGYAEFVRLPARVVRRNLFPKPRSLSFAEAALLEPLSCVVFGLGSWRIDPEATVVILGAGAIALLHLVLLRHRGVSNIWVVARNPLRAEVARSLGARQVFECDAAAIESEIQGRTAGRGADLVVECTGRKEVWEIAPRLARRGGEVVLFGGCPPGTSVTLDTGRLHYDQVHLRSPFHFDPHAVREARDLLAGGAITTPELLSGTLPLERVGDALRSMARGEGIKYVIEP